MAGLTQIDWQSVANEANVQALLEDFVSQYTRSPVTQLALAVWFGRSAQASEHKLLMLFTGSETNNIELVHHSLLWQAGVEGPPFVAVHWTSVAFFALQLRSNPNDVHLYFCDPKVIYFQRHLLSPDIANAFGIITKPPGLIEVWCVSQTQYKGQTVQSLLGSRGSFRREVGIVKTWEAPDFETCKAIVHVEVGQRWLPSSPEGISVNGFYTDVINEQSGFLLEETGVLYQIVKFEVIYDPDYGRRVIERRPDDRYVEVYLRAVHPPEKTAA